MEEIDSESKFVWRLILSILATPFTLLMMLFGKRNLNDLMRPFGLLFQFMFQAKATIILIIINIVVYFSMMFFNEEVFTLFLNYPSDFLSIRIFTIITSGFMHADLSHLFFNMIALFIFGRVVEKNLGINKFLATYFGALVLSNIISSGIHLFILDQNIPGLGASGAIYGLMAAAMLTSPFYLTYELIVPLPITVVGWLTISADISGIITSANDGIGHFAHLAGFISVCIILYLMEDNKENLRKGILINIGTLIIGLIAYLWMNGWKIAI
ncbi:MAG: rhomboid family intramembrane serine protease [Candidatus Woesearchaeota archaeon]